MTNYTPEEMRIYHKTRRNSLRAWVAGIKEATPCTDCGVYYPWYVMHWDHLPGTDKKEIICRMVGSGQSRKTIQKEMDKCELVCANCHAERTHGTR